MKKNFLLLFFTFLIAVNSLNAINLNEAIKRLESNDPTLTSLNLSRNGIRAEGAQAIADALKENNTLTSLNLEHNEIGADGVQALADALKENRTLTSLNLSRNGIRAEGAQAIADALKVNNTLTSLNLEHNRIGAAGARALADALKENSALTSLNLEGNEIGDEGALALADALKVNRTLTSLNLGRNGIGDEGALAIADALKENNTLTSLNLGSNGIHAEGAQALADALRVNTTLTSLDLSYNRIGDAGVLAVEQINFYLDRNRSITPLKLDFLKALKEGIEATVGLKGTNFNQEFVKTRLGLKTVDQLNDLNESDLKLLLKWAYSDIYWLPEDAEKITLIIKDLGVTPISFESLLERMYFDEGSKDVGFTTLDSNSIGIKAHSFILATRSGLFKDFLKEFAPSNENAIPDTSGLSRAALNIILHFIYTNKLEFTNNQEDNLNLVKEIINLNAPAWFQFSESTGNVFYNQLDAYIKRQDDNFKTEIETYENELDVKASSLDEQASRLNEQRLMEKEDPLKIESIIED
ncbi:MAG: BTB/POZ domain-containing protein [bacterium]